MKKILSAISSLVATYVFQVSYALAQFGTTGGPASLAQGSNLVGTIQRILNYFLALAGILAVAVLIYGGVQYIISRGDEGAAEKAKNTIVYAIIGLVVIGLSVVIVNFVINGVK